MCIVSRLKLPLEVDELGIQANSTGRGEKPVREYLEEHYKDETIADEAAVLKLVVKALSQVVQSGAQNIEIAVLKPVPGRVREFNLSAFYYDNTAYISIEITLNEALIILYFKNTC